MQLSAPQGMTPFGMFASSAEVPVRSDALQSIIYCCLHGNRWTLHDWLLRVAAAGAGLGDLDPHAGAAIRRQRGDGV
eukprot:scaffold39200_cov19-Tisochrysis_lutea.AAC.4